MLVFILGTAGSGKTTLAKNFSDYLKEKEEATLINLDPGNDLNADVNIRDYVKAEDVMRKYNLGPNSALIKSIELMYDKIDQILSKIPDVYWKIIDTPGQLELFLYKDIGKRIVKKFKEIDNEVALVFLVDVNDVLKPENLVSILAWQVIISLRLEENSCVVINKKDLLSEEEMNKLKLELKLKKPLEELKKKDALSYMIAESFKEFYEYSTIWRRPIFISALKKEGFDELEDVIRELFCTCGDIS